MKAYPAVARSLGVCAPRDDSDDALTNPLVKTDAALFEDEKNIVTRPANALLFSYAQYSPYYPYPSPHRSFSRLGL